MIGQKVDSASNRNRVKPTLAVKICDPIRTRSMFHVRHISRDGVMPVDANVEFAMLPKREDHAPLGSR